MTIEKVYGYIRGRERRRDPTLMTNVCHIAGSFGHAGENFTGKICRQTLPVTLEQDVLEA
jgi:hypothetical protein